jgi:hypothetical protein
VVGILGRFVGLDFLGQQPARKVASTYARSLRQYLVSRHCVKIKYHMWLD